MHTAITGLWDIQPPSEPERPDPGVWLEPLTGLLGSVARGDGLAPERGRSGVASM